VKILLTGGDGFTGRYLAAAARAAGHDVALLRADVTDPVALAAGLRDGDADAVIHLAGIAHPNHRDTLAFYRVNALGTANLLDALAATGHRPRVVVASSAAVYAPPVEDRIAETHPTAPGGHYGMSKLLAERLALDHPSGLRIVIARPFNYTGPGQSIDFVIPKLIAHYARRAPSIALGNDVEREFNDVHDVAAAYLLLAEAGEPGGIYNLCSGRGHALGAVLEALGDATLHRPGIVVDPALIRANEAKRIVGDPGRLQALARREGRLLPATPLTATLSRMLAAYADQERSEIRGASRSESGTSR
jgi:GDP-6-deoxy-D-talose 4-dehydrogenase